MKQIIALLMLFIAAKAICEEPSITEQQRSAMRRAAAFHTFTTVDGEELSGRPIGLTKETNSVNLETADGSERTIALPTLSEEDLVFINDWLTGYSLFADNKICFTVRKKTDMDKEFKGDRSSWHEMFPNMKYKDHWSAEKDEESYDEITYELRLENKCTQTLSNILVEYRIYHQTTIEEEYMTARYTTDYGLYSGAWVGYPNTGDKYPEQIVSNIVQGAFSPQEVPKQKKITMLTNPLKLVEKAKERANYYTPSPKAGDQGTRNFRIIRGKLLGICCRVYAPTQAGNYAMAEFSTPNSLIRKTEWVAPE